MDAWWGWVKVQLGGWARFCASQLQGFGAHVKVWWGSLKVQLDEWLRLCASELWGLASLAWDNAAVVTIVAVLAGAGWALKLQRLDRDRVEADLRRSLAEMRQRAEEERDAERDDLRRSLAEMRQRAEEERESRMCDVCLDRDKDVTFGPCGHQSCSACAASLRECHMCRRPSESRIATFGCR